MPIENDVDRLDAILELAERVERQICATDRDKFILDDVEIDALAFRLGHIGETTKKLSDDLKFRHPEIAWSSILAFRNIMFHSYLGIEPQAIWDTARFSLPTLVAVIRFEREQLGK